MSGTNGATQSVIKTVKIGGVELELEMPYAEGHVLTAGEAAQFNQTFRENVGNNFRKTIEKMIEEGKEASEIQTAFDEYVNSYEMGARKAGGGPRLDPVDREMRALAKKALQEAFAKKGYSWKDTSEEEKEAKIAAYLAKYGEPGPHGAGVRAAATSIIETRKAVANAAEVLG